MMPSTIGVFLREKQYLTREGILHESTDDKPLHGTLINFIKEAKRKRDYTLLEFFQQDLPEDFSLKHPVFVTPDEADHYQSFENQTLEVIDRIIIEMMEGYKDEHTRQTYHDYFKAEVFRKKKSVHLDFFNEVLEVLNEQALEHNNSDDNIRVNCKYMYMFIIFIEITFIICTFCIKSYNIEYQNIILYTYL